MSDSASKSRSAGSSPVFGHKNMLTSDSASSDTEAPPIPSPRGASLLYSPPNPSPTHVANPVSPLATSLISAHPGGEATTDKVMPLAVAIHETCNAIFKGTDASRCMVKVTGEVVMSFPASFLPLLDSYQPLSFSMDSREKLERVLHNQNLLQK